MIRRISGALLLFFAGCATIQISSQPTRESIAPAETAPSEKIREESPPPFQEPLRREELVEGKPKPPALPESIRAAIAGLPKDRKPVLKDGKPLTLIRDLDADDAEDFFLLTIVTEDPAKANFDYLSDFRRLFDPQEEAFRFHVEVFLRKGQGVSQAKSIDVGVKRVCAGFEEIPFRATGRFPYGVSLLFPSTDGKEHVWVIFSSPLRHAVFSFQERSDVKALIRDIDGNGLIDLLLFEDVFEDATGYETYITWYRWDGTSYRKHRSTNIVRNLRRFFSTSREFFLAGSWRRFFDYALSPQEATRARQQDESTVLSRLFKLALPENSLEGTQETFKFDADILRQNISEVVFPEVLENPFPIRAGRPESFSFTLRVAVEGENYFFTAKIGMNPNPFSGKMFYFLETD